MRETDYVIVGAGAAGLAFADTIVDETDATITMVDRRERVGGHWRDAYPFVRLHLSSALYGVNSTPLGKNERQTSGRNAGFYEQATGDEVCAYFDDVLHTRLEANGRVTFLGGHEHLGADGDGVQSLRDLGTGEVVEVRPRRKVVDARYLEASVPATHTPSFTVSEDAAFASVNDLPVLAGDYGRFTVIGGGKTAFDACLWLLDQAIDPDRIRWVRPREMWLTDRAGMQPLDDVGTLMDGLSRETEACAEFDLAADVLQRLEECGRFLRLDESSLPTRWVGTMVSRPEVDALRTISDVVRMGHVEAVEGDRLTFAAGSVSTAPGTLHVDCSATGLNPNPPTPVFSDHRITVQNLRHNSPSFNAALIAWVEAHRDEADKNRLTPPNRYVSRAEDMVGVHCRSWATEAVWRQDAELSGWIEGSRLNLTGGLKNHLHEPTARAGAERYVKTVGAAVGRHRDDVRALFA
jgi:hypothetical protein